MLPLVLGSLSLKQQYVMHLASSYTFRVPCTLKMGKRWLWTVFARILLMKESTCNPILLRGDEYYFHSMPMHPKKKPT